jgi:ubiquinone/menaquinone biosynthesis C-methylase UbiE
MSNFDQATIERTYQNWAKVYEWLTPIYLLGNEKRLRRETIASLYLRPGQTVLDVGCGAPRGAIKQYLKGKETIRKVSSMPQYC